MLSGKFVTEHPSGEHLKQSAVRKTCFHLLFSKLEADYPEANHLLYKTGNKT